VFDGMGEETQRQQADVLQRPRHGQRPGIVLASRLAFLEEQGILSKAPSPDDRRKDFYTLTEKGLDLIPIVLNIVLWSAKHDSKSYVRRRKDYVARLSRSPMQVSEEVKALVRNGGCIFPEGKE
jgi:hypothetical protein